MTLSFATWVADLSARGHAVLAASHAVPIQLWLREPGEGTVLHFLARGTRVTLRRYAATDLTTLVLRAECDCEEHRTAGAGSRTVLTPGARPTGEVVVDGAEEFGWTGIEAGRLDIPSAAELFGELRQALDERDAGTAGPVRRAEVA